MLIHRQAFEALVAPGRGQIDGDLDYGALLIAASIDSSVDIAAQLGRIDALAERTPGATSAELAISLFGGAAHDPALHFAGNRGSYYEVDNSLLHRVLDRRIGIPITLAVLLIEIGRRKGVSMHGVGMPGHFLVGSADGFVDPFGGGGALDVDGCRSLFQQLAGPGVALPAGSLEPTPPALILRRILANLAAIAANQQQRKLLYAVRSLIAAFPRAHYRDHVQHAYAAAELGQFVEAAQALELALPLVPESVHDKLASQMAQWRARMN